MVPVCLTAWMSCKSINSSMWLHLKLQSFLCSALWFMIPFTLGLHSHILSKIMLPMLKPHLNGNQSYLTRYKLVPTFFVEHLVSSIMLLCPSYLDPTFVSLLETGSHTAQAGPKLTMLTRITVNSESSCLFFPSERTADVHYHAWIVVPMFSTSSTYTFLLHHHLQHLCLL